MRILNKVPNSVLWIYVDNTTAKSNLETEAKSRGIDSSRLIFASKIPLNEHLARLRLANLFLDTFPYNAGATASNSLSMSLPIITRSGESFASRYGASLLTAIGAPELITKSADEFESLAVNLATHPEKLASIKRKLEFNLKTYPLFDTHRFTRNIESAYQAMYKRFQNNLLPDHIFIAD
jgi:predicted O-linked N-acetylglucosamine transferase (SPINDLY family)